MPILGPPIDPQPPITHPFSNPLKHGNFVWFPILGREISKSSPQKFGRVEVPRRTSRYPSEDLPIRYGKESERSECFLGMCQLHSSDQAYVPLASLQAKFRGNNKKHGGFLCWLSMDIQVIFVFLIR